MPCSVSPRQRTELRGDTSYTARCPDLSTSSLRQDHVLCPTFVFGFSVPSPGSTHGRSWVNVWMNKDALEKEVSLLAVEPPGWALKQRQG